MVRNSAGLRLRGEEDASPWLYLPTGVTRKTGRLGENMFDSEEAVAAHHRRTSGGSSTPGGGSRRSPNASGGAVDATPSKRTVMVGKGGSLTHDQYWPDLKSLGWRHAAGEGMEAWMFLMPGVKKKTGTMGFDMFNGEAALQEHINLRGYAMEYGKLQDLRRAANAAKKAAALADGDGDGDGDAHGDGGVDRGGNGDGDSDGDDDAGEDEDEDGDEHRGMEL